MSLRSDEPDPDERLRQSNPAEYGEDETFPEDFRRVMRKVFAPLNWLRRR